MKGIGWLISGLALVVIGVVWLVATLARGGFTGAPQASTGAPTTGQTTLDSVKAHYAKGEITKDQFEEMKRDLRSRT